MEENVKAADVALSESKLKTINSLLEQIKIVGERYDPESENGKSVRK